MEQSATQTKSGQPVMTQETRDATNTPQAFTRKTNLVE